MLRSLVNACAISHEAAVLDTVRVMVRPMHQAAKIIPFVHASKSHTIADSQRCTPGDVDIVRNQECLPVAHVQNETLVPRSIVVVAQQSPDETRSLDPCA